MQKGFGLVCSNFNQFLKKKKDAYNNIKYNIIYNILITYIITSANFGVSSKVNMKRCYSFRVIYLFIQDDLFINLFIYLFGIIYLLGLFVFAFLIFFLLLNPKSCLLVVTLAFIQSDVINFYNKSNRSVWCVFILCMCSVPHQFQRSKQEVHELCSAGVLDVVLQFGLQRAHTHRQHTSHTHIMGLFHETEQK